MSKSRALEMFQNGQGVDCVIEVAPQIDGEDAEIKEFNVHKYVLMLNSDVFHAMFSHKTTKEAREGRIQIEDSTGTAVHQMLLYMYTGELPTEYVVETDAGLLMHIANKYQIKALVQLIERGLVFSLSLTNVLDRLEMADLYQINSLYSSCGQLIQSNLKTVKKDAKWLELKKRAPELAFAILEDVEEFGNGKLQFPDNSSSWAIKLTKGMGTNVIKFTAPTGNDTMYIRGSQQSVMSKHMCISGMQEYKGQSLEELRIADYLAGRKVNTRAPTETTEFDQLQGAGLFGPPVNPSGGIFTGSTTSVPAFPVATAITSLFGTQSASASAEPSRSIFGQTSASGSIFGQTSASESIFGQTSASESIFGQTSASESIFGQTSASESIFGQTSARGGIFTGATTSVPAFPVATTAKNSLFGIGTKAASAEPSGSIFNPTSSQSQEQTTGIFGKLQSPVMAPLSNSNIGNVSSSMAKQQDERPQFGLHQNPLNGTIGTAGNTHNFGNDLKEQELMISNLEESKNQALHAKVEKVELMPQGALENLEFKTENRALKENVKQKANDHALEAKMEEFPNMHTEQQNQMVAQIETLEAKLSTQNEEHQKQMEELESKNRMLEEKLRNVELADKRELNGKMEQPKDECSNSKMPPGLDVE